MFQEEWSRVLAASVAPVVIISACALLCLAFYNRLAAIITRLRAVQRERLEIQERLSSMSQRDVEHLAALRQTTILESLAEQSVEIQKRAKLIRATLLCLLLAILTLIISSLLNGLTIVWPGGAYASAVAFITGMLLLFAGITCAVKEMLTALDPAHLELTVVAELTGEPTEPDAPHLTHSRH
jgi:hypothetical protein